MIGGWSFVWAAYAVAGVALAALTIVLAARFLYWRSQVRALDAKQQPRA